jgi:hypothetical protein
MLLLPWYDLDVAKSRKKNFRVGVEKNFFFGVKNFDSTVHYQQHNPLGKGVGAFIIGYITLPPFFFLL